GVVAVEDWDAQRAGGEGGGRAGGQAIEEHPKEIWRGFGFGPICFRRFPPLTRRKHFHRRSRRFANRDTARPRGASVLIAPPSTRGRSCTPPMGTLPFALTRRAAGPSARSCRMPRQPLDAREDLMKERPGQVAFRELQREVRGVPDQPAAGLEQPLLETRQRPVLDSDGENEAT